MISQSIEEGPYPEDRSHRQGTRILRHSQAGIARPVSDSSAKMMGRITEKVEYPQAPLRIGGGTAAQVCGESPTRSSPRKSLSFSLPKTGKHWVSTDLRDELKYEAGIGAASCAEDASRPPLLQKLLTHCLAVVAHTPYTARTPRVHLTLACDPTRAQATSLPGPAWR
jgi:hypothetical protein